MLVKFPSGTVLDWNSCCGFFFFFSVLAVNCSQRATKTSAYSRSEELEYAGEKKHRFGLAVLQVTCSAPLITIWFCSFLVFFFKIIIWRAESNLSAGQIRSMAGMFATTGLRQCTLDATALR